MTSRIRASIHTLSHTSSRQSVYLVKQAENFTYLQDATIGSAVLKSTAVGEDRQGGATHVQDRIPESTRIQESQRSARELTGFNKRTVTTKLQY
jgi:hypothetical protein